MPFTIRSAHKKETTIANKKAQKKITPNENRTKQQTQNNPYLISKLLMFQVGDLNADKLGICKHVPKVTKAENNIIRK